jgi:hypothetical protein
VAVGTCVVGDVRHEARVAAEGDSSAMLL